MENFADILRSLSAATRTSPSPARSRLKGTVVSLSAEQVFVDIGYKTEGVLPRSAFANNAEGVKPGDKVPVSVKGRNEEDYYELSRFKVAQPRDWTALEEAFAQKLAVVGTVTAVIKGGLYRRHRRARLYARQPQRHPRCSRARKAGRHRDHLPHHQARRRPTKTWSSIAAWCSKNRPALQQEGRLAAMKAGDSAGRHGAQPHALRSIRRSRRRRRPAARQRHLVEPRQQARRRALRRPADPGPHSQDRSRDEEDFAWPQAASTRAVGCRARRSTRPDSASPARLLGSPTSAPSSRSSPASRASSTSLKCPGAKRFAIPAMCSSRATQVDAVILGHQARRAPHLARPQADAERPVVRHYQAGSRSARRSKDRSPSS